MVNTEYGQGRRIIELGEFVLVSKQPVISPSKQGNVLDLPTPVPPNTANPHESGPSRGPVTITQPKSPRARNEIPIFLPRQPSNDPVPSQSHLLPVPPSEPSEAPAKPTEESKQKMKIAHLSQESPKPPDPICAGRDTLEKKHRRGE